VVLVSSSFARYQDVQGLNLLLTMALRRVHLVFDRRGLDRKVRGHGGSVRTDRFPPRVLLADHVVGMKVLTSTSPSERKDAQLPQISHLTRNTANDRLA
jgi:hypothetical protein